MTIQKTVEIPASRRLTIEVPREVPLGRVVLTFTPKPAKSVKTKSTKTKSTKPEKPHWTPEPPLPRVHTLEEAIAQAEAQAARRLADPSIPLFNGMWGCLKDSKAFEGDPVAIQREMRDEWPD
ncbi:hypothetical protein AGMMS50229_15020 [Campylobacterota bacterium]|nr:hypothetical protein AGMMS50229_15020 [Campylobacterota bacterium]